MPALHLHQHLRVVAALGMCGALLGGLASPVAAQTFQPLTINSTRPDLSVSMSASPTQVGGGGELTSTDTIQNLGVVTYVDRLTGARVLQRTRQRHRPGAELARRRCL